MIRIAFFVSPRQMNAQILIHQLGILIYAINMCSALDGVQLLPNEANLDSRFTRVSDQIIGQNLGAGLYVVEYSRYPPVTHLFYSGQITPYPYIQAKKTAAFFVAEEFTGTTVSIRYAGLITAIEYKAISQYGPPNYGITTEPSELKQKLTINYDDTITAQGLEPGGYVVHYKKTPRSMILVENADEIALVVDRTRDTMELEFSVDRRNQHKAVTLYDASMIHNILFMSESALSERRYDRYLREPL